MRGNNMKKAKVHIEHSASGTVKYDDRAWPPDNFEIKLSIAPDCRVIEVERLFEQLNDLFVLWCRNTDNGRTVNYVIEGE